MNLPICDKCNKPVDKLWAWKDEIRFQHRYKVTCHGETELSYINEEELVYLGPDLTIVTGRAFVQPKRLGE